MTLTNGQKQFGGETHLVRVATRLIATVGPEISVDQICGAAGCSKGAFYHHFRSKRELLLRVVATLCADPLPTDVFLRLLPLARRDREIGRLLASQASSASADPATRLAGVLALGEQVLAAIREMRPAA